MTAEIREAPSCDICGEPLADEGVQWCARRGALTHPACHDGPEGIGCRRRA